MNIKNINNEKSIVALQNNRNLKNKYQKDSENTGNVGTPKADKLELSSEAQRLQPIIDRVNSGFYSRPEVINATAGKINKQM